MIATLTVRIHVAWWLRLYLQALVVWCTLTNMPPSEERVMYWIMKGLSVQPSRAPRTVRDELRRVGNRFAMLCVLSLLTLLCATWAWWLALT